MQQGWVLGHEEMQLGSWRKYFVNTASEWLVDDIGGLKIFSAACRGIPVNKMRRHRWVAKSEGRCGKINKGAFIRHKTITTDTQCARYLQQEYRLLAAFQKNKRISNQWHAALKCRWQLYRCSGKNYGFARKKKTLISSRNNELPRATVQAT